MSYFFIKQSKRRGFTLVELLVVISIISLLSSIILASLKGARDKAAYSKGSIELRSIESALEFYYQDHGDYYPVNAKYYVDTVSPTWTTVFGLALKPYLSKMPVPGFTSVHGSGGGLNQGFLYTKGTLMNPYIFNRPTYNGKTGLPVACVTVYDGYWLDMVLPEQSQLTLNDGGADPDGMEIIKGNVSIVPTSRSTCP